jgi:hypothetical protein
MDSIDIAAVLNPIAILPVCPTPPRLAVVRLPSKINIRLAAVYLECHFDRDRSREIRLSPPRSHLDSILSKICPDSRFDLVLEVE